MNAIVYHLTMASFNVQVRKIINEKKRSQKHTSIVETILLLLGFFYRETLAPIKQRCRVPD